MSHGSERHSHHAHRDRHGAHAGGAAAPRMGRRHAGKLFILNAVLFLACAAFAGLIMRDYLPTPFEMEVIAALIVVPIVMAGVATFVHIKAHRWTSVDDMAERFTR